MKDSYKKNDEKSLPWTKKISKPNLLSLANEFGKYDLYSSKPLPVLEKLIFLLNNSEQFSPTESSKIFFCATKLFHSKNHSVKKLVYHILSELKNDPQTSFMAINALLKELTAIDSPKTFQADAIKTLSFVIDSGTFTDVDRYLKMNVVGGSAAPKSAALLAGAKLFPQNAQLISRWAPEAKEALKSPSHCHQTLALGLLSKVYRRDKGALRRLLAFAAGCRLTSPFAQTLLLAEFVAAEGGSPRRGFSRSDPFCALLSEALDNGEDFVRYEAVRAVFAAFVKVPDVLVGNVVEVIRSLLSNFKDVKILAGLGLLGKHGFKIPSELEALKPELESLVGSPNKTVAALAMIALVEVADENCVDRLIASFPALLHELPAATKSHLLDSVVKTAERFPQMESKLVGLLSAALREEADLQPRLVVIDALAAFASQRAETREKVLAELCEFLEDCDHRELSLRVIRVLGQQGAESETPSNCVRHIFNRLSLELPYVRLVAVEALARLGERAPALRDSVRELLSACCSDEDDEVRASAALRLQLLQGEDFSVFEEFGEDFIADLDRSLDLYAQGPAQEPFSLEKNFFQQRKLDRGEERRSQTKETAEKDADKTLADLSLGEPLKETEFVALCEAEFEYFTQYRKTFFAGHVALSFEVTNAMDGSETLDVAVQLGASGGLPLIEKSVSTGPIEPAKTGRATLVLKRSAKLFERTFSCELRVSAKLRGEDSSDLFNLEDVSFRPSDYVVGRDKSLEDFKRCWTQLAKKERIEKLAFATRRVDLRKCALLVARVLGLSAVQVSAKEAKCVVNLCGASLGGESLCDLLGRAILVFLEDEDGRKLVVQISLRGDDSAARDSLLAVLAKAKF